MYRLLAWDEETYLPPGGAAHRADQLAFLAGLEHQKATDPRLGELLGDVDDSPLVRDPLSDAAVNVREWRRQYARLTRLPQSLVEETARVTSLAQTEWAAARRRRRLPSLSAVAGTGGPLKQREAEAVGYETEPYDALLDEYEPGARGRDLDRLFAALGEELTALARGWPTRRVGRTPPSCARVPDRPPARFGETAATALGFDFTRGRLDPTTHPFFTTVGPGDCRITMRYDRRDFSDAFFSTLHEVGHGLYEQGLDPSHYGLPVGECPSLGLHESQSRLWENAVGRGLAFWQYFFPQARRIFPEALSGVGLEEFHFAVNRVEPSLIRVRADE